MPGPVSDSFGGPPDDGPTPVTWTWCRRSNVERLVSCSATGICDLYCAPDERVPETPPFESIDAVFTLSSLTSFTNCEYVRVVGAVPTVDRNSSSMVARMPSKISQFRHAGGGGGAGPVVLRLSPGSGGLAGAV